VVGSQILHTLRHRNYKH